MQLGNAQSSSPLHQQPFPVFISSSAQFSCTVETALDWGFEYPDSGLPNEFVVSVPSRLGDSLTDPGRSKAFEFLPLNAVLTQFLTAERVCPKNFKKLNAFQRRLFRMFFLNEGYITGNQRLTLDSTFLQTLLPNAPDRNSKRCSGFPQTCSFLTAESGYSTLKCACPVWPNPKTVRASTPTF